MTRNGYYLDAGQRRYLPASYIPPYGRGFVAPSPFDRPGPDVGVRAGRGTVYPLPRRRRPPLADRYRWMVLTGVITAGVLVLLGLVVAAVAAVMSGLIYT